MSMGRKIEIIETVKNEHCKLFLDLEKKLKGHNIQSIKQAEYQSKLAESFGDIETADIDHVWSKLWDKPLYAGMRETTAIKWKKQLENLKIHEGKTRIEISSDPNIILDFKKKSDVKVTVPDNRLLSIHLAAKYLSDLKEKEKRGSIIFPNLKKSCNKKLLMTSTVEKLKNSLGRGWGHTTVFHFFTDIGISIKPDLHVARTLNYIGISEFIAEIKDSYRPNQDECIDIHFAILQMNKILIEKSPRYTLRYIDKILMNFSRDGLLNN